MITTSFNLKVSIAALLILLQNAATAQIYDTNSPVVQTFVGSGFYGYYDGVGEQTMFNNPLGISSDVAGNLYVLDAGNGAVRLVTPQRSVSTYGNSKTAFTYYSQGMTGIAIDKSTNIWTTLGYSPYLGLSQGIASFSFVDVRSISGGSGILNPSGACCDSSNRFYFSDSFGNKIYRITTNTVLEVFAGSGNPSSLDGNWIFTSFHTPTALACDAADNIYVWDSGGHVVRKIDQLKNVTTIAGQLGVAADSDGPGNFASFLYVGGMGVDAFGNLILACGSSIRRLSPSRNVTTIAGSFFQTGYSNTVGSSARFSGASDIAISQGVIYVADSANQRIRSIAFGALGQIVPPSSLQLYNYPGLQITGITGRTYQIQTSPDMQTWTSAATLMLNSSPYLWIDQSAVGQKKFYRAMLLP